MKTARTKRHQATKLGAGSGWKSESNLYDEYGNRMHDDSHRKLRRTSSLSNIKSENTVKLTESMRDHISQLKTELLQSQNVIKNLKRNIVSECNRVRQEESAMYKQMVQNMEIQIQKEYQLELEKEKDYLVKQFNIDRNRLKKVQEDAINRDRTLWQHERDNMVLKIDRSRTDASNKVLQDFERMKQNYENKMILLNEENNNLKNEINRLKESERRHVDENRRIYRDHQEELKSLKKEADIYSKKQLSEIKGLQRVIEQLERKLGFEAGTCLRLQMEKDELDAALSQIKTTDLWGSPVAGKSCDYKGTEFDLEGIIMDMPTRLSSKPHNDPERVLYRKYVEMSALVRNLDSRNQQLAINNKELMDDILSVKSEYKPLEDKITSLGKKNMELSQIVRKHESKLKEIQKDSSMKDDKLVHLQEVIQRKDKKLLKVKRKEESKVKMEEFEDLQRQHCEQLQIIAELRQQNIDKDRRIDVLKNRNSNLRDTKVKSQSLDSLNEIFGREDEDGFRLEHVQRSSPVENEVEENKHRVKHLMMEHLKLQKAYSMLQNQYMESTDPERTELDREALKSDLLVSQAIINDLENRLEGQDNQQSLIEVDRLKLEDKIKKLEEKKDDFRQKLISAESDLVQKNLQLTTMSEDLRDALDNNELLEFQLTEMEHSLKTKKPVAVLNLTDGEEDDVSNINYSDSDPINVRIGLKEILINKAEELTPLERKTITNAKTLVDQGTKEIESLQQRERHLQLKIKEMLNTHNATKVRLSEKEQELSRLLVDKMKAEEDELLSTENSIGKKRKKSFDLSYGFDKPPAELLAEARLRITELENVNEVLREKLLKISGNKVDLTDDEIDLLRQKVDELHTAEQKMNLLQVSNNQLIKRVKEFEEERKQKNVEQGIKFPDYLNEEILNLKEENEQLNSELGILRMKADDAMKMARLTKEALNKGEQSTQTPTVEFMQFFPSFATKKEATTEGTKLDKCIQFQPSIKEGFSQMTPKLTCDKSDQSTLLHTSDLEPLKKLKVEERMSVRLLSEIECTPVQFPSTEPSSNEESTEVETPIIDANQLQEDEEFIKNILRNYTEKKPLQVQEDLIYEIEDLPLGENATEHETSTTSFNVYLNETVHEQYSTPCSLLLSTDTRQNISQAHSCMPSIQQRLSVTEEDSQSERTPRAHSVKSSGSEDRWVSSYRSSEYSSGITPSRVRVSTRVESDCSTCALTPPYPQLPTTVVDALNSYVQNNTSSTGSSAQTTPHSSNPPSTRDANTQFEMHLQESHSKESMKFDNTLTMTSNVKDEQPTSTQKSSYKPIALSPTFEEMDTLPSESVDFFTYDLDTDVIKIIEYGKSLLCSDKNNDSDLSEATTSSELTDTRNPNLDSNINSLNFNFGKLPSSVETHNLFKEKQHFSSSPNIDILDTREKQSKTEKALIDTQTKIPMAPKLKSNVVYSMPTSSTFICTSCDVITNRFLTTGISTSTHKSLYYSTKSASNVTNNQCSTVLPSTYKASSNCQALPPNTSTTHLPQITMFTAKPFSLSNPWATLPVINSTTYNETSVSNVPKYSTPWSSVTVPQKTTTTTWSSGPINNNYMPTTSANNIKNKFNISTAYQPFASTSVINSTIWSLPTNTTFTNWSTLPTFPKSSSICLPLSPTSPKCSNFPVPMDLYEKSDCWTAMLPCTNSSKLLHPTNTCYDTAVKSFSFTPCNSGGENGPIQSKTFHNQTNNKTFRFTNDYDDSFKTGQSLLLPGECNSKYFNNELDSSNDAICMRPLDGSQDPSQEVALQLPARNSDILQLPCEPKIPVFDFSKVSVFPTLPLPLNTNFKMADISRRFGSVETIDSICDPHCKQREARLRRRKHQHSNRYHSADKYISSSPQKHRSRSHSPIRYNKDTNASFVHLSRCSTESEIASNVKQHEKNVFQHRRSRSTDMCADTKLCDFRTLPSLQRSKEFFEVEELTERSKRCVLNGEQNDVTKLKRELNFLHVECKSLERNLKYKENVIQSLQDELKEESEHIVLIEKRDKEIHLKSESISQLTQILERTKKELQVKVVECQRQDQQIRQLRQELKSVVNEKKIVDTKHTEQQVHISKLETCETQLHQITEKYDECVIHNRELVERIKNLEIGEKEFIELERNVIELQVQLRDMEDVEVHRDELIQKLNYVKKQRDDFLEKGRMVEEERNEFVRSNKTLEQYIVEWKKKTVEFKRTNQSLKDRILSLEKDKKELEGRIVDLQDVRAQLQARLNKVEMERDDFCRELREVTHERNALETRLAELEDLLSDHDHLEEGFHSLRLKVSELTRQRDDAEMLIPTYKTKVQVLKKTLREKEDTIMQLSHDMKKLTVAIENHSYIDLKRFKTNSSSVSAAHTSRNEKKIVNFFHEKEPDLSPEKIFIPSSDTESYEDVLVHPSRPYDSTSDDSGLHEGARYSRARRCVALFDYEPKRSREMRLNEGDYVTVFGDSDSAGFLNAECNGMKGLVPSVYVEEISDDGSSINGGGHRHRLPSPGGHNTREREFVALYDYDPYTMGTTDRPDLQLSLSKGDTVTVVGDIDVDGYFTVVKHGKRYLVPSNFVRESSQQVVSNGSSHQQSATATQSFEGTIELGDIVGPPYAPVDLKVHRVVTRSAVLLGWQLPSMDDYGRSNKCRVTGYRIWVNGKPKQDVKSATVTKALVEGLDLRGRVEFSIQTIGENGFCSEKCHFAVTGALSALSKDGDSMQHGSDTYVALYDYDPFKSSPNPNPSLELKLSEGDLVRVTDTSRSDGFYFAEIRGKKGLVPSNFIEKISASASSHQESESRRVQFKRESRITTR